MALLLVLGRDMALSNYKHSLPLRSRHSGLPRSTPDLPRRHPGIRGLGDRGGSRARQSDDSGPGMDMALLPFFRQAPAVASAPRIFYYNPYISVPLPLYRIPEISRQKKYIPRHFSGRSSILRTPTRFGIRRDLPHSATRT